MPRATARSAQPPGSILAISPAGSSPASLRSFNLRAVQAVSPPRQNCREVRALPGWESDQAMPDGDEQSLELGADTELLDDGSQLRAHRIDWDAELRSHLSVG